MSEVKNPVLVYADSYRDAANRGQKLADIWSVITDLERNIAPMWEAQRLRADTAEAELRTERLRADAAVGDANEAERKLAAAEQRIAELTDLLRQGVESIEELLTAKETSEVLVDLGAWTINSYAALNPKPEAESHG